MAKAAEKIENTVEFPSFDTSKATDQLRAMAEKGVEQSKEAYAKLKTGAEEVQKVAESTYETARAAGTDLSLKTIAAMRANAEASFAHLEVALRVRRAAERLPAQAHRDDDRAGQGPAGRLVQGRRGRRSSGKGRVREGVQGTQGRLTRSEPQVHRARGTSSHQRRG
jgi:hypothetical protein